VTLAVVTSSASPAREAFDRSPDLGPCTFGQQIAASCPFGQWTARPGKKVQRYFAAGVVRVLVLIGPGRGLPLFLNPRRVIPQTSLERTHWGAGCFLEPVLF
jgi:hypothetical protein